MIIPKKSKAFFWTSLLLLQKHIHSFMAGNSIGTLFKLVSFGESHSKYIGGVVEGCPSNINLDLEKINHDLARRKPQAFFSTARVEDDNIEIISGLFEGKTLGSPIAFLIKNNQQHSSDYDILKDSYRPSHADYTYQQKYGIRDHRGGGRASARETATRVVAGSIAKQILHKFGISITAYTSQIGTVKTTANYKDIDLSLKDTNPIYCPDPMATKEMETLLNKVKEQNDSIGGTITCIINGCPAGIGEPIFDKLQAELAKAIMSIPSAKGFEYGDGFEMATMYGSETLDVINNDFSTSGNHSGGIQGGITNGQDIVFKVAFKPIASIGQPLPLTDKTGNTRIEKLNGRHDSCQVPRAVPIVEAMAAIVLTDQLLQHNAYRF